MKIGKEERKILEHLISQRGIESPANVCCKFAPFYRKAGDRTGSTLFGVIWNRMERMEKKGLVFFTNKGRTDCRIQITEYAEKIMLENV